MEPTFWSFYGMNVVGTLTSSDSIFEALKGQPAMDTNRSIAFITSQAGSSIAAVSYVNPAEPEILDTIEGDTTNLYGAYDASYDADPANCRWKTNVPHYLKSVTCWSPM